MSDPSPVSPEDGIARLKAVLQCADALTEASERAISWTRPGTCGRGAEFPCRHTDCIERAGRYAAMFTREAAHHAAELARLVGDHAEVSRLAAALAEQEDYRQRFIDAMGQSWPDRALRAEAALAEQAQRLTGVSRTYADTLHAMGADEYDLGPRLARDLRARAEQAEASLAAQVQEIEKVKRQRDDALAEMADVQRFWQAAKHEIERLRAEADIWERGIGENQNSRLYREFADSLTALSGGATASREGFDCAQCGHRHQGERFAFICIGCPCPATSEVAG